MINTIKRFVAPIVIVSTMASCASLELNSFKVLGTTVVAVDVAMKVYAQQVVAGKVSQATQDAVRKDFGIYQEVMRDAQLAVDVWKSIQPEQRPPFEIVNAKVQAAVARANVVLQEVK